MCMIEMNCPDQSDGLKSGLALLGKAAVAASFTLVYLYSAELFPTEVRYIIM